MLGTAAAFMNQASVDLQFQYLNLMDSTQICCSPILYLNQINGSRYLFYIYLHVCQYLEHQNALKASKYPRHSPLLMLSMHFGFHFNNSE